MTETIINHVRLFKKKCGEIHYYDINITELEGLYNVCVQNGNLENDEKKIKNIKYDNKENAILKFGELFENKTGNKIGDEFEKKIDKYDINLPGKNENDTLNPNVIWLVNILSNEESIKSALTNIGLDTNLLPIEKITKKRILKAIEILDEIKLKGYTEPKDCDELLRNYYLYIPYKKQQKINILSNIDIHIEQTNNIRNLYETFNSIIKYSKTQNNLPRPIKIYGGIGVDIDHLESGSTQYEKIIQILKIREPSCIKSIKKIYKINNPKQAKKYDECKKNMVETNWGFHGSPMVNWFSILKNGFYLDATKAGVKIHGKAYGNGIYFSTTFQYSYGFCFKKNPDDIGLMCICGYSWNNNSEKTKKGGRGNIEVVYDENQYNFEYILVV